MASDSTIIPSESRTSKVYNGVTANGTPAVIWSGQDAWLTRGAKDDEEARHAPPLANSGSPQIPEIGDSHKLNRQLICTQLPVESRESGAIRIVRAIWETQQLSLDNPLAAPARILPEWCEDNEELEKDVELNVLITDTGGFPFQQGPPKSVFDLSFTIARNEPFFPLAKSLQFKGVVNKGSYTIPGVGSVSDGQALCLPIRTTGDYAVGGGGAFNGTAGGVSTSQSVEGGYVTCIYTLRLRADGWTTRIKNAGINGWYTSGSSTVAGRILNAAGNPVSEPIPLDAQGKPLLSGYTVEGSTPVKNPNKFPPSIAKASSDGVFFLYWNRYKKVPFSPLFGSNEFQAFQ